MTAAQARKILQATDEMTGVEIALASELERAELTLLAEISLVLIKVQRRDRALAGLAKRVERLEKGDR